ncbi:hypothetical protein JXA34_00465 [Patescibacteria group bacterium]|nr:hypothetical protein [Patescibacteria group bacterium]
MFWRRKRKVTISETFFAVLIVLILMLGTLLFAAASKTRHLQSRVDDLQVKLNAATAMLENAE